VGIVSHFQVGDWTFRPPQRVYNPLTSDQEDQDYAGILYGDPSGNWSGLDALAAWEGAAAEASRSCFALNLPESECSNALAPAVTETSSPSSAQAIVFPIVAHDARGLISADAFVRYDAGRYVLRGIRTTAQTEGFMVAANDRGGYVRIAMAGTKKLNGDVRLLELVLEPATQAAAQASVVSPIAEVVCLVVNEGASELTERADEGTVGTERTLPSTFYLGLPRPNPFGDGTTISYGLPSVSEVELSVFDVAGKKVRTLVDGTQPAGRYSLVWDGSDGGGRRLANGIYFIRMKAPTFRFERKVTLSR